MMEAIRFINSVSRGLGIVAVLPHLKLDDQTALYRYTSSVS